MFFFTYAAALLSTIFVVVAAVFFVRKPDQLRTTLATYLFTASIWIGANAVADVSHTRHVLILMSEIAYCGGVMNLFFCILLVDILVDQHFPKASHLVWYGIPCVLFSIAGFSSYAITGLYFPTGEPAEIVPGVLYTYTMYVYIAGLLYCIIRLRHAVHAFSLPFARRMQLLYILAGLIITASAALTFDVILPIIGELRFYTLGPIGALFFAAASAYAISRHEFLDIRLVIQRGAIYTVLSGMVVLGFFAILESADLLFGNGTNLSIVIGVTTTTVIGLIAIPRFEKWFQKYTDPWFFKDRYNYADALHSLSEIVSTSVTSEEVVTRVEDALKTILRVSSVAICLHQVAVMDGCESETTCHTFPIVHDGAVIGAIHVGLKLSGELFTREDSLLLSTLVYQTANALLRVSLHRKVEQYADELEQTVEMKTKEIRILQERQEQMILDVSHNLQTPLAIFQTQLEHAKGTLLTDTAFTGLEHSLGTLSNFIYDLLALTAMDNTLKHESCEPYDLSELMMEIRDEVEVICSDSGITIRSTIAAGIIRMGNRKRMREALVNVLSNSVKYMGVKESNMITITLEERNTEVTIIISDTGIGIASGHLPHIFNRFYRANILGNIPGTGLGLAIANDIIERQGGRIEVSSVVGEGTSFIVNLQ